MFRQSLGDMNRKVVFLLGIDDVDGFEFADQYTGITYLTTTFCIERSFAQYNLVEGLVFLLDLAIAQDAGLIFCVVVAYEFSFTFF